MVEHQRVRNTACGAGQGSPGSLSEVSSREEEKEHSTTENPRVLALAFFGGTAGWGESSEASQFL